MLVPDSVTQLVVTLVLVVPGFVFQAVRIRLRGRSPGDVELTTRVLSAIALSTVFALLYFVALGPTIADATQLHDAVLMEPRRYAALGLAAAFVVPAIAAYVVVRVRASKLWVGFSQRLLSDRWTQIDTRPTAWEVAFGSVTPCFVRTRMKDGSWYAGWLGEASYASSWPDPQSLFVEISFEIDSNGVIGDAIESSRGSVIDCTDAVLVELLGSSERGQSGSMGNSEVSHD